MHFSFDGRSEYSDDIVLYVDDIFAVEEERCD